MGRDGGARVSCDRRASSGKRVRCDGRASGGGKGIAGDHGGRKPEGGHPPEV